MPKGGRWRDTYAAGKQGGFTIVELMVTLVVAAILIGIAIPSFRNIILSSRLTTTANQVVDAINTAKVEAIKRNNFAQLCSNLDSANSSDTLGTQCGGNTGQVVALGVDASGNAQAETIQVGPVGLASPLRLSGNFTALRFNGLGLAAQAGTSSPYSGLVADICTDSLAADNHRMIYIATGSVVQVLKQSGTCSS
ncbi:GspH/FimT family pseudopilin [Dyella sp. C9]|uniref:GspH/FimT family pseudopilin n=1 Tax=Dyella sp. C9 TaxID=2202154 RepID=UPI001E5176CB|nr:GspH/FimT family pseudopilin [Dyella sp. C9]